MDELIRLLNEGNYSCVVRQGEETRTFSRRGVADLYDLYATDRAFLKGAWLADKVIGKGAAALMVLCRRSALHHQPHPYRTVSAGNPLRRVGQSRGTLSRD